MSTADQTIVIAGAARTAIGNFQGAFTGVPSTELGSRAISSALERAKVSAEAIDEVLMGCVLPAGLGQAPARQASLGAGVPLGAGCATVNKVCGSGMKTVMMAHDAIKAGSATTVVAGGMESMTNAPHMLPTGRTGIKFGHGQVLDHMAYDGLEDAYDRGKAMGIFAEKCAREWQFSREAQDEYAMRSVTRAQRAIADGSFKDEIVAVEVKGRKETVSVDADEKPGLVNADKIPALRPAFEKDGTVTAGSSSAISDGAAALIVTTAAEAEAKGYDVLARIAGHATHSQAPEWFTTAPVQSIANLMAKTGWAIGDVDLFEVNEAFAVVPMAFMQEMGLPRDKVNVNGGACALGHPIGASGTRIMVTLLNALETRGLTRGVAAICIGGGEGTAIAIERI